jgi:hypothetical protein
MASNFQIFVFLVLSWILMFAFGCQAKDIFAKPKYQRIRRFKVKLRKRRRRVLNYSLNKHTNRLVFNKW